ncbi:MAG: methylated-DNA--[protein]-cysteine S-methyltransferase [Pontibacterium sp.]
MKRINIQYYNTAVGELMIGAYDDQLCMLDYRYRKMREAVDSRIKRGLKAEFCEQEDAVITEAIKQVDEYLAGKRKVFDLPLLTVGTDFQKNVWNTLLNIEYGQTATYLGLASKLDNAKAVRAVASANGANAMSIVIPCHRIIASDGGLGGYAGGLNAKKRLLELEQHKVPVLKQSDLVENLEPVQNGFNFA